MTDDTPTPAPAPEPLGSGYLLEAPIGSGAMGQVWRAATRDGAPVAIKVLRPELSGDPAVVARFVQEAQILQRLDDPHLVRVRDLVAEGSRLAIVMDLVDGPDLRSELVRRGTFRPIDAAEIVDGVLSGLAAVHAGGVVHRDVKPENVLLSGGQPVGTRLTDFGVARIVEESQKARRTTVIGTPEYLAPEVADGETPTAASDLYAVGIVLYELVCGVTPFSGGSPLAVLRRHADQQPVRPEGMPDGIWNTVVALLAKDPARRPQSAADVRRMLTEAAPAFAALPALPALTQPPTAAVTSQLTVTGLRAETEVLPVVGGTPPRSEAGRRGKRTALVAALAVVVLLLGGGAVAFALTRGSSNAAAAAATTSSAAPTTSDSPTPSPTTAAESSTASATAGVVPSVIGQTLAEAQTALTNAGLVVQVNEKLDDSQPDNTVLAQDPAAGGTVAPGSTVNLTVARKAVGVFLSTLQPVPGGSSSMQVGTATLDGQTYVHAITSGIQCSSNTNTNSTTIQYDLGRSYQQLSFKAGLTDDSDNQGVLQFVVLLDGRQIYSKRSTLGHPVTAKLDVTGGLRLEISAARTDACTYASPSVTPVWADPLLLGPPTTAGPTG